MTRETGIGGEGSSLVALDRGGRPAYLPPNCSANAFFLWTLRSLLLCEQDRDDDGRAERLRLAFATPRRWLADGGEIRAVEAPSEFGRVSDRMRSELAAGRVRAAITPPPRAAEIALRVRLPDGWRAARAECDGAPLAVDAQGTIELGVRGEPFEVTVAVTRSGE
jgi:hypothetical protein